MKKVMNDPDFNDIVFENRNKEYGAYQIRKKYDGTLILALLFGIALMGSAVVTPYIMATNSPEIYVVTNDPLNPPPELIDVTTITPPPPPPPQPVIQPAVAPPVFLVPLVVDSMSSQDLDGLDIADNLIANTKNDSVVAYTEKTSDEIIPVEKQEKEPLSNVQERPSFYGGDQELIKYIQSVLRYPQIAVDNNIQGKVYVRFCVSKTGSISRVSIERGVDPLLDAEAMRVVQSMPNWKPGKQDGNPVDVWYVIPIGFVLKW